ncbi:hypothetical protein M3Y99_01782000 [Aphelenchoides fujianensis]|nr:hypothetical protein M3Y99_01782000 [Aphelenchoides fujianensis]
MKVDVESETSSMDSFEPWDSKYRCCCGSVHAKQGALIVGIISGVLIFYSIVTIPVALGGSPLWNAAQVLLLVVDFATVLLLFRAIKTENPHFLLPYLVYSAHTIVLLIFGVGFGLFNFFWPLTKEGHFLLDVLFEDDHIERSPQYDEKAIRIAGMFTALSCLFALALTSWWASVVYKCYKFFKACNRSRSFLQEYEDRRYLPLEFE